MATTTLAERIGLARKRAKMKQDALADALDVGRNSVSAWETGASVPEGRYLMKMPVVLGVDGHWLLTGDGEPVRQEASDVDKRLKAIRRLVDLRRPLPDEDALFDLLGELPDGSAEGLEDVE